MLPARAARSSKANCQVSFQGSGPETPDIPQTLFPADSYGNYFLSAKLQRAITDVEKLPQRLEILLNKNEIKMQNKCYKILENLPPIAAVSSKCVTGAATGKHDGRGH